MRLAALVLIVASARLPAQVPELPKAVNSGDSVKKEKKPNTGKPATNTNLDTGSVKGEGADATKKEQAKAQKGSDDAEANRRIADYTEKLASYTRGLVWVGAIQIIALAVQAIFLRLALRDTRQSFVLSQPPRLIVRNVTVRQPTTMTFMASGGDTKNQPITGQFYVANVGGTRASIREVYSMLGCGPLPMERPYETLRGNSIDIQLLPGQSTPIVFPTTVGDVFDGGPSKVQIPGGGNGYIIGWVEYGDDAGNRRRTAFCRRWDTIIQRFYAVDDADYEHAE
jgi:hypothetical protein